MKFFIISIIRHVERLLRSAYSGYKKLENEHSNVEVFIQELMRRSSDLSKINDPAHYVSFLRACFSPLKFSIDVIKDTTDRSETSTKRFLLLIDRLKSDVPPTPPSVAQEIALLDDKLRYIFEPKEYGDWAGDVGLTCLLSSSGGSKGRLLSAVIRFCQSEKCLEVGTGYGLSALFMLHMLKAKEARGHLATVEAFQPQLSLSSEVLKNRFGDMVSCHHGKTEAILADVVKSMGRIDFMFHDGGHTKDNFTRDFSVACAGLARGSVVLFDDIHYENELLYKVPPKAYEGWLEVVAHPRVKMAVESVEGVDRGLLLLD